MKIKYETPEINVWVLSVEDVIATSTTTPGLNSEEKWTPSDGTGDINWGDLWS